MMDDMLKAQSKVIDILCNLELIYPPTFVNIMIHLVIHLPLEAIDGGPIRPRWMYPFERFMKKLKYYVRNKAKLEGLIAKSYVAEEALTFSSYYFRDVTMKFNRPDRNVDCPPLTLIWYVLHNRPEIDTYQAKFKSEFPNKDMKEEFPGWFGKQIRQCHVDNNPGVGESSELFALAYGPSQTLISVNSCVVNGVRYPTACGGFALGNRGKGTRKPNLGGRKADRPHTRQETRNLSLTCRPHMESDRGHKSIAGHPASAAKDYIGKKCLLSKKVFGFPEEDGF
ncbi:hypothetical protein Tco_1364475 [Tanacetum coccineum]